MDKPWVFEIQVEGHIVGAWSEWFDDLNIDGSLMGRTILSGLLIDQAALFGVLNKIHSLNINLISVTRSNYPEEESK